MTEGEGSVILCLCVVWLDESTMNICIISL